VKFTSRLYFIGETQLILTALFRHKYLRVKFIQTPPKFISVYDESIHA